MSEVSKGNDNDNTNALHSAVLQEKALDEREAHTYRLISDMLGALTGEKSYEVAMNSMMEMVASIVKPDRLCLFECTGPETIIAFELCAEGIDLQEDTVHSLPSDVLKHWFSQSKTPVAVVPDTSVIAAFSPALHQWCEAYSVTRFMAVPFRNDGEIVGFLGAYNYHFDGSVDIGRLFEAISSFVGARIDNRRLIDDLDWNGKHDELTSLLNRRGAQQAVDEIFSRASDASYTVAIIDIDDFKQVNDMFGHAAGDEALKALARTMEKAFPEDSVLSRNGGDEFLAVIPGERASVDELIASFTLEGVDYAYDDKTHHLTLSIGYACFPEHGNEYQDLYNKADVALYAIKLDGKEGYRKYSPEVETHYRTRLGFSTQDLADNVPCGIAVHLPGSKGVLLYANAELVRLTGYSNMHAFMERFGGMYWGIAHPDDREQLKSAFAEHAAHGKDGDTLSTDFRIKMKSGDYRKVHCHSRLVNMEELGTVYYTVLMDCYSHSTTKLSLENV